MRHISLILLCFLWHKVAFAQTALPNHFAVGNFLEVLKGDSLKVYYSCTGIVTDRSCADRYRIGKIASDIINVTGPFTDFYMDGSVYLKATMLQNSLEGEATFYYPQGTVKEQGTYKAGLREGKWTYFYENGQPEKTLSFTNGLPQILEAYARNGKVQVTGGNGVYKNYYAPYLNCSPFAISGEVKNGLMHGRWYMGGDESASGDYEVFENGRFISGKSNRQTYTDRAYVGVTQFTEAEHVNLLDNQLNCPGWSVMEWKYQGQSIQEAFYPALITKLNKNSSGLQDQWLVVGLDISTSNKLSGIQVYSSLNDTVLEQTVYDAVASMKDWKTALIHSKPIKSSIYFSLLVMNQQIIIPTHYLYQARSKHHNAP